MPLHRSCTAMILDILLYLSNHKDPKKTRCMYHVNTHWTRLTQYLDLLENAGLINGLKVTPQGREIAEYWRGIRRDPLFHSRAP